LSKPEDNALVTFDGQVWTSNGRGLFIHLKKIMPPFRGCGSAIQNEYAFGSFGKSPNLSRTFTDVLQTHRFYTKVSALMEWMTAFQGCFNGITWEPFGLWLVEFGFFKLPLDFKIKKRPD
jgi:hypothetical protein